MESRHGGCYQGPFVSFENAKVVIVGDTGAGKSGLGLVLAGQPFAATESTHGRLVWTLDRQPKLTLNNGRKQIREVLL